MMRYFKAIFGGFLLVASVCTARPAMANSDAVRFSENVNLSLRRTVDLLLRANGDSLSQIPPVKQTDANTFSVQMDHMFDYDKLPETLQRSFNSYHIDRPYSVAVLNCETGKVSLGYQFFDLNQPGGVPCRGRSREAGCYTLQVRFTPEAAKPQAAGNTWLLITAGGTLAGLGFIAWTRSRHKKRHETEPQEAPHSRIAFGNSWLDTANQALYNSQATHTLTFREAKLLTLFVRNINQVLERDAILKSVWEDEGVTVGRSVDVFVSRLRKMLAADPQVKITAIHGVGYKMEVHS
ncbi:DNA-binding winged helix-turn-helix (wHTH) protein [Dyadobacter sp. BE34]|uniref:DNA-binding winged helix-turn-helix (WHTH) protein n=1 Tax=Dyadobacter fermentans TaxID=94254 RepID=A0ABU1QTA0_9BACT|nr:MULTISPECIES: winged helix-turn-helix domain-containing protein [Dyadobacter]MDR6803904.1 DNA-binding winged helix-turn-helix (wHTH) protein [Dyadobacter fermentans]MDR7041644.1 DNA-binding winged helix-turn-helix (wHTH) protein [Dyadobacter sp. BE242]MDR7196047.1 DNA-binding winged helix-turn-helix (wHTH) protein [Dyadobacter sp. BE34]MDR7213408.1 DNA-binding winged helix-turn-helix (wHTH) protein [Dyadobacter sp. BE31]MDR7261453.1 DNA-binding winged helix-turn-helix (wHTH) protein [Dyadob